MGKRYQRKKPVRGVRQGLVTVAAMAVLGIGVSANAFEIPTDNEDVVIHWDNTFRYTLAQRLKGQSDNIVNSANHSDGDRNFDVGLVSSRIDLLTETDMVYKKDFGIRLSGALWYDPIYREKAYKNNYFSNHFENGAPASGLNRYTMRQFGGPDGELLDAFAFAKVNFGDVPVNIRAGRHTIYWGEAFFPGAGNNGISYGQSPIDMAKALTMPGVELKEIFRPLNQVSVQVQPTNDLTIAGQYYLEWEPNKFPETGSYLGMVDGLMNSGEAYYFPWGPTSAAGPGMVAFNTGDHRPSPARDWGIKLAYSPEWLNGTLGFHYRNFSDKMPQVLSSSFLTGANPPLPTNYYHDYKSNISLYGISFAKQILGISVGSEISYRRNMPLTSQWFAPAGARGDTMHAVLNFLTLLPKTPLFDTGSAILEFAYGRWNRVSENARYFTGNTGSNAVGAPTNQGVGHSTRDNSVVTVNLVPEWKQVLPGVDLAMPLNFSVGMHGNAATLTGGTEGTGSYSAGLSFDVFAKYKIDLTYASFFGKVRPDAGGQIAPPGFEGPGQGAADAIALLRDRDLLSLTLKATF
ncbi:DUF1302 domain-containing protein [Geobacter argillaceus]|uniref:Uncharacterized protein DUF1302 n=1 Tax=Geobacter argillaceus TaxID=345631 RepID=A0A562V0T1_9BACT|nr:DUF1302 family protein [Geobacter argillaceus]TWJ11413.1 uncharacterized protein DUF1302 [Geobacter argillaceus]